MREAPEQPSDEREREYAARWARGGFGFTSAFRDLGVNKEANDTAAEFVRSRIRATVHDPAVAEDLSPRDHPIGTKQSRAHKRSQVENVSDGDAETWEDVASREDSVVRGS